MSSISPYPEGVSGGNPGDRDGDRPDAPNAGGYGTGTPGSPDGYPPGATSSGSAAFAAPPPGTQPAYGGPAQQQGQPAPGYGPPGGPNPGYGQQGAPYGQPPQNPPPPANPQAPPPPANPQAPPPGPTPPASPYPPQPGQSPQQPPQPQYQQQPPQYQQPPQTNQVPPAPHATGPEPVRDMPMAGRSPIRRNIDDTAELPAFLDSAMSDETPGKDPKTPERGVIRKFPLTTGFTALLRHRRAMSVLVRRDLAVKYQATFMGYLWSLIEPLGLAVIYWLIFGVIFGRSGDIPNGAGYALYIIAGVFAWQWFTSAMSEGARSLGGQSSLITVMKVPREVFPISKVFARFAEYVVGFPILIGVAVFFGGTFGWNLLWLFPAILLQAIMLTGVVFVLSAGNVLFKDVQRFLSLIIRVLFYSSAIIYPLSRVQEALAHHEIEWVYTVFTYSPLVVLFQLHRAVWIPDLAPNWYQIGGAFGFSIVLMFLGRWIFYRLEPRVLKAL